jgi:hypothetical protein
MNIRLGSIVIVSILIAGGASAQTSGSVSGRILAEDTGLPLEGVTVNAIKSTEGGPVIASTVSSAGGEFIFDNVSPGIYRICVHEAGEYLNPCEWDGTVSVNVSGSSSRAADIRLKRGVWLSVRIADPNNLVATLAQKLPGGFAAVFVTNSTGASGPVPLTSSGHGVYEYSKLVMPNSKMTVIVNGIGVQLGNGQGTLLPGSRYSASITIPAVAAPTQTTKLKLPLGLDRVRQENTTVVPLVIASKP